LTRTSGTFRGEINVAASCGSPAAAKSWTKNGLNHLPSGPGQNQRSIRLGGNDPPAFFRDFRTSTAFAYPPRQYSVAFRRFKTALAKIKALRYALAKPRPTTAFDERGPMTNDETSRKPASRPLNPNG
jgi:hypothetical protein